MAIIEGEDGIEVQILCDGQPLHEYEDADLGKIPGTTTKFIVAETGRAFVIRCIGKAGFRFRGNAIICYAFIDGKQVSGKFIKVDDCKLENCVRDVTGARTSPTTAVEFLFSDLEINSDTNTATPEGQENIGTIEVKAWHVIKGSRSSGKHWFNQNKQGRSSEIHEKDSKGRGLSHSVKFGSPFKVKSKRYSSWRYVKQNPKIGQFTFHYRSLGSLKAMLIVPRTPSPPPIEARKPAELSHDEIAELQRQVAAQKASWTKIKLESTDESRPRKKARITSGLQIFELGDDDEFRETRNDSLVVQGPEVIELD